MAGLATARSCTSKIIDMAADIAIISPLIRQSFLLSSSTVFMFSIQIASTGPSKVTQFRLSESSLIACRTSVGTSPSVHSCVVGLTSP